VLFFVYTKVKINGGHEMSNKQLQLLRQYHGMTQIEFAKTVGIAPGTLSRMESGLTDISSANKAKILRKYDLLDDGFLAFCERMKGAN